MQQKKVLNIKCMMQTKTSNQIQKINHIETLFHHKFVRQVFKSVLIYYEVYDKPL